MGSRKTYWLILLYMVAPILSTLIAGGIAHATSSRLDEADPHPCLILGVDIGAPLCFMGMAFWLVIFTFPTGLLAILVVVISRGFRRRKAGSRHIG